MINDLFANLADFPIFSFTFPCGGAVIAFTVLSWLLTPRVPICRHGRRQSCSDANLTWRRRQAIAEGRNTRFFHATGSVRRFFVQARLPFAPNERPPALVLCMFPILFSRTFDDIIYHDENCLPIYSLHGGCLSFAATTRCNGKAHTPITNSAWRAMPTHSATTIVCFTAALQTMENNFPFLPRIIGAIPFFRVETRFRARFDQAGGNLP